MRKKKNTDPRPLFRVFKAGQSGWRLVHADDADKAARRFKGYDIARPVHPSSWHRQQRETATATKPRSVRRAR